jgi:hypothetical protein
MRTRSPLRLRRVARRLPIGTRGQALVEFALVAPVFFLLLFAVIEGGRFILYYETLANATREGARYAIVHGWKSYCPSGTMPPGEPIPTASCYDPTGASIVQKVKDSAFGLLGTTVAVTPTWLATDGVSPGNNGRDNTIHVVAAYTYTTIIPLPLPPISITAESSLVINN